MSDSLSSTQIAGILADRVDRSGSPKANLLCTAEILRTFTDAEHGLRAKDIAEVIGLLTGKAPSEAKVLDDVHAIARSQVFGMELDIPSRGKVGGIRCVRAILGNSQLRLLVNMVQTCKFATADQREELTQALHGTASYYQQERLVTKIHADRRERPASNDAFNAADVAWQALGAKRMIEFAYCDPWVNDPDHLISQDGSPVIFEESPIQLIYSFGNYYLETWAKNRDGEEAKFNRRLDRMRDARVSPKSALVRRQIRDLRNTVEERTSCIFDMWGGDENPSTVFLRVEPGKAKYVYDRFGVDVIFGHQDGGRGYVCVQVQLSPTFYRWLFGMGDGVVIVKPESLDWVIPFSRTMPQAMKPYHELLEDYSAARAGFMEQVRRVMAAYSI